MERRAGSVPSQIKAAAKRQGVVLPDGWKTDVALRLVSSWAQQGVKLPVPVLVDASNLFAELTKRFEL